MNNNTSKNQNNSDDDADSYDGIHVHNLNREGSGDWSSQPDLNESLSKWTDKAYQYHQNVKRYEEVSHMVEELHNLCAHHFVRIERMLTDLSKRVNSIELEVNNVKTDSNDILKLSEDIQDQVLRLEGDDGVKNNDNTSTDSNISKDY